MSAPLQKGSDRDGHEVPPTREGISTRETLRAGEQVGPAANDSRRQLCGGGEVYTGLIRSLLLCKSATTALGPQQ